MAVAEHVLSAFSSDHVVRLTRLSQSQLRYWDRTGFFRPRYSHPRSNMPHRASSDAKQYPQTRREGSGTGRH
jgi:hypothetical protein